MSFYKIEKESRPGMDRLVNEKAETSVLIKRLGAEIIGYDVWDAEHGKTLPLLWNNNNDAPPFEGAWKNHATILFPIVGGLKNDRSRYGDVDILLQGNHGFARRTLFDLVQTKTEDCAQATYRTAATSETKALYPFDFSLELIYTLKGNSLALTFRVKNTGKKNLPFQFGWHPGFNTELGLGGKRKDWKISFPKGAYTQFHVLDSGDSFLTGKTSSRDFDGPIPFTDRELFCTLMYEIPIPANRRCRLYNPVLRRGVEVRFRDLPHVGLWANEGQDYLCIEPWQGMDDHEVQEPFDKKIGMLILKPGERIDRTAAILPLLPTKEVGS
jgi:galactose mutarotase-like enzyme